MNKKTNEIIFKNRECGARELLKKLPIEQMKTQNWIVIAMSAGGYKVAKIIAKEINAKIDFIITKKIRSTLNSQCVLGVISETKDVLIHQELAFSFDVGLEDIYASANEKYNSTLLDDVKKYKGSIRSFNLKGYSVLLVDDGLQTSITAMTCIKSIINQKAKSVSLAIPILPLSVIDEIEAIADDLYYVSSPHHFIFLEGYYDEYEKVEYKEV
jgi:putative phosphoribosyl transferase